jgi:NADH-ubiquinone oxidoreductase chain 1
LKIQRRIPWVIFSPLLGIIFIVVPVLVNVAFFTLLERKILGLRQSRKGPNKISTGGLLQPFADAIKLFVKEIVFPLARNQVIFFISPATAIFLVLWAWRLLPLFSLEIAIIFSSLLLLVILSLNLYPLLIAGWASNRKYAIIGAMRGVAQTISYEIRLALILLRFLVVNKRADMAGWLANSPPFLLGALMAPLLVLWLVSCVAETNRTPFDFAEGESELVSGFNIEYGGGGFAMIFMAEYARILFLRLLSSLLVLGARGLGLLTAIGTIFLGYAWVWLRATYPRYRYDSLMGLAWKRILPAALALLTFFLVISTRIF